MSAEVVIRLGRIERHARRVGARWVADRCAVALAGSGDALVELLSLEADLLAAPGGRAALEAA